MEIYDVIIIGSGPAGLTAAIYTTRANLKTLVIGGRKWGGQLMLTTLVENYPGFPEGIQGPDLMMAMRKQAEHHGAEIRDVDFTRLQLPDLPDMLRKSKRAGQSDGGQESADHGSNVIKITTDDDHEYESKTVIIATGADTKWLEVPGEKEKIGRGVSSCAPCDGAFFRNKRVIVVGGGDSAMEEALVMTKYANEVTLIHRRDSFRASEIMQKRVRENPKIKIMFNTEIMEVLGEMKVERVRVKSKVKSQNSKVQVINQNQEKEVTPAELGGKELGTTNQELEWEMPIDGIFVAVGHFPNSGQFHGIETDDKGFIKVREHTKTNVDRVFVAGDVHDATYKQAVTAAGFGCMAALEVEKYLMESESK